MIRTVREGKRGCGFRQPGGIYLRTDSLTQAACGLLPFPLTICPTCSAGVKPTRGWTWVSSSILPPADRCAFAGEVACVRCPLSVAERTRWERYGLIWIGASFYPLPSDWMRESETMGVSRKIKAVPKDFVLGETWVLVAHRYAVVARAIVMIPGVFHAFRPTRIEYVVRGSETPEEIERLEKRGFTLVRVERINDGVREETST